MIRNYLKIAWRNLKKNQVFSFINIFGLSLGLACFVLIALYVSDELRYDRHHEFADRIYRVDSDIRMGGTDLSLSVTSDPMGETLKAEFPQVLEYVRIYNNTGAKLIRRGSEFIQEEQVAHADSTLFDLFTLPVIAGQGSHALNAPNTVVISESAASRYFGSPQAAVGQVLETNDPGDGNYQVTAVFEDIPEQSHFHFDFFFSMQNVSYNWGNYGSHNFHTYLLLAEGADPADFPEKFEQIIVEYLSPLLRDFMDTDLESFRQSGNRIEYSLMPLTDIHLQSDRSFELEPNGNIQNVYIFGLAALFVLVIACVNFMNLSTARSAGRAREVGIRKTLGSRKPALVGQFLTESTLLAALALALALGLCALAMPWFNDLSGKSLVISDLWRPGYLLFLLLLPFVVGILAGLYPAFFLAAFNPVRVLKGGGATGNAESRFRNALVVFQFAVSIILIIGTLVIYNQLEFIRNMRIGFDKEQVVVVETDGIPGSSRETFKNEAAELAGVHAATFGGYLPVANSSRGDTTFSMDPVMTEDNVFNMQIWRSDFDYIPTLGMELLQGRNFSREFGTDSTALIINERAAKILGVDNPVGEQLYTQSPDMSEPLIFTIIGVVRDFNFESLRQNVGPLAIRLGRNDWVTAFRVDPQGLESTLAQIEARYREVAPGMPFTYTFLDESFDQMYRQEQRMGQVALSFAVLAILIACLGLFGLVTYVAEQRTREIGIRKVLGASLGNILGLLSRDFLKLVLIAFVIGSPVAWWAMHSWLEDFAYRVPIGAWIFLATGGAALGIALLTVAFKAVRAALANPVKSLRTE
ncbi:ABC transporter permease [Robiginitalea biformata]|uniref:Putative FtsX-related transmembrane transport protein n=1 Tax=Robiginitalea biformata (strain ATCC BAA-864 / DSM 15991 / KCTC 12146 / HTCC2501) TaxID=313596 RepID=A4CNP9_ROBBH|nr:ABC transporter permease [Robiginitalea biformata]EAR14516.1 putative FtsX-related transmembrane transport protein [Robiginitalea biformata HTCC2501]